MIRDSKLICLVTLAWCLTSTVGLAVNCNCCCKEIDTYGYDQPGAAGTKCWKGDHGFVLEGLVVDAGVCIQAPDHTGVTFLMFNFYGCQLTCANRNPAGFNDPNPLQEATGQIPPNALSAGTMERATCQEPPIEIAPPTICG